MEMKIDIELIKSQREKRAWTQSQLAKLSGLSLRTIQRIEKAGLASQESAKSIASVLEIPVERLQINQNRKIRSLPKWAASIVASFAVGLFILSAKAEPVMIDLKLSKQEELVTTLLILNESGSESVVEISELLRLKLVSELLGEDSIRLNTELFDISSGKEVLIGTPEFIAQNQEEVEAKFGDFSLSLTPSK